MKQVRFGKRYNGATAAVARRVEREDQPRLIVRAMAGLVTGFLVAAIECL